MNIAVKFFSVSAIRIFDVTYSTTYVYQTVTIGEGEMDNSCSTL